MWILLSVQGSEDIQTEDRLLYKSETTLISRSKPPWVQWINNFEQRQTVWWKWNHNFKNRFEDHEWHLKFLQLPLKFKYLHPYIYNWITLSPVSVIQIYNYWFGLKMKLAHQKRQCPRKYGTHMNIDAKTLINYLAIWPNDEQRLGLRWLYKIIINETAEIKGAPWAMQAQSQNEVLSGCIHFTFLQGNLVC